MESKSPGHCFLKNLCKKCKSKPYFWKFPWWCLDSINFFNIFMDIIPLLEDTVLHSQTTQNVMCRKSKRSLLYRRTKQRPQKATCHDSVAPKTPTVCGYTHTFILQYVQYAACWIKTFNYFIFMITFILNNFTRIPTFLNKAQHPFSLNKPL